MRVLIVYGSKRGGTAGLAEMIGDALVADGLSVDVRPARTRGSPLGFDAVIVAGALYAFRWHRDARRFARRHAKVLRGLPVWLVASGPLDDSARAGTLPPVRHVAKIMASIGARGQVTFGGRLEPDAKGFPASAMAKRVSGDWRDPEQVREFAAVVARSGNDRIAEMSEVKREPPENAAEQRPTIDLSTAIGEAGHEVQELGYEGIPDTGPTLDERDDDDEIAWDHLDATMSQFPPD
jgi:menaquinone-dependent protoporphyrinogen oxidase